MKKILLIYNYTVVEPLGILVLTDYLQQRGHQVDISDYQSLERQNFNFGSYDFVGFSILAGSHNQMLKIADQIRNKAKIVIGGPYTISFSEECKKHADFVVRGFGERILLKIVEGEIKDGGIYSESIAPQDLFISSRETFYQNEKRRNNPIKNIITGFCCPYQCTYCYNSIVQKEFTNYRYNPRPVDSVIKECKTLLKYPLKLIAFEDDTFGVNLEWMKEFTERYKREINLPFHCNIRIELATDERIKLFKEAGCLSVTFSIESASEKIRKELLNRHMTNEQIFAGIEVLRKYGITFRTQQMLGLPTTTIQDDLDLLKMNCQINPLVAWTSIFSPLRGTPIGEFCAKEGYYDGNNDDIADNLFSHSVLNFPEKRKKQIAVLNKVFTILAHLPRGYEMGEELMETDCTMEDFYKITKSNLYDEMYNLDKESARKTR
ncbi:MAG: radical SAM protein [Candidatus Nealsonbacteria bacterium]|nr:radical SAM protein [Candidatus Nealsonbacteria bacterium]